MAATGERNQGRPTPYFFASLDYNNPVVDWYETATGRKLAPDEVVPALTEAVDTLPPQARDVYLGYLKRTSVRDFYGELERRLVLHWESPSRSLRDMSRQAYRAINEGLSQAYAQSIAGSFGASPEAVARFADELIQRVNRDFGRDIGLVNPATVPPVAPAAEPVADIMEAAAREEPPASAAAAASPAAPARYTMADLGEGAVVEIDLGTGVSRWRIAEPPAEVRLGPDEVWGVEVKTGTKGGRPKRMRIAVNDIVGISQDTGLRPVPGAGLVPPAQSVQDVSAESAETLRQPLAEPEPLLTVEEPPATAQPDVSADSADELVDQVDPADQPVPARPRGRSVVARSPLSPATGSPIPPTAAPEEAVDRVRGGGLEFVRQRSDLRGNVGFYQPTASGRMVAGSLAVKDTTTLVAPNGSLYHVVRDAESPKDYYLLRERDGNRELVGDDPFTGKNALQQAANAAAADIRKQGGGQGVGIVTAEGRRLLALQEAHDRILDDIAAERVRRQNPPIGPNVTGRVPAFQVNDSGTYRMRLGPSGRPEPVPADWRQFAADPDVAEIDHVIKGGEFDGLTVEDAYTLMLRGVPDAEGRPVGGIVDDLARWRELRKQGVSMPPPSRKARGGRPLTPEERELVQIHRRWSGSVEALGTTLDDPNLVPETVVEERLGLDAMREEGFDPVAGPRTPLGRAGNAFRTLLRANGSLLINAPLFSWAIINGNLLSDVFMRSLDRPFKALSNFATAGRDLDIALARADTPSSRALARLSPRVRRGEVTASTLTRHEQRMRGWGFGTQRSSVGTGEFNERQFRNSIRHLLEKSKIGNLEVPGGKTVADVAEIWEGPSRRMTYIEQVRRGAFIDEEWDDQLVAAFSREWSPNMQRLLVKRGMTAEAAAAAMRGFPAVFFPDEAAEMLTRIGRDAGMSEAQIRGLVKQGYRSWLNLGRRTYDAAVAEVNRALPEYEETNADRYLGSLFAFTQWHTRATLYMLEEMLSNPYILNAYQAYSQWVEQEEERNPDRHWLARGMLRLGTGPFGLALYANPSRMFLTSFLMGQQAEQEDADTFLKAADQTLSGLGLSLWPAIRGSLDLAGFYGTGPVQNPFPVPEVRLMGQIIDVVRSQMGQGPGEAVLQQGLMGAREIGSGINPFVDVIPATDPQAGAQDAIVNQLWINRPDLREIAINEPERWARDIFPQLEVEGSEYYDDWKQAWREVAGTRAGRTLINAVSPLRFEARNEARDADIMRNRARGEAIAAGQTVSSAQDEANIARAQATTNPAEPLGSLRGVDEAYDRLVDPYDRGIESTYYWVQEMLAANNPTNSEATNRMLAQRLVQDVFGPDALVKLDAMNQQREEFRAANPEAAPYLDFRRAAREWPGGQLVWARNMMNASEGYRRYIQGRGGIEQAAQYGALDSVDAYIAATGGQGSVYDPVPVQGGGVPTDAMMGRSVAGDGGAGFTDDPAASIAYDIMAYQRDAAQVDQVLAGLGLTGGMQALSTLPNMVRPGYEAFVANMGLSIPELNPDTQQYLAWLQVNPNGTPEQFIAWRDAQRQAILASYGVSANP